MLREQQEDIESGLKYRKKKQVLAFWNFFIAFFFTQAIPRGACAPKIGHLNGLRKKVQAEKSSNRQKSWTFFLSNFCLVHMVHAEVLHQF